MKQAANNCARDTQPRALRQAIHTPTHTVKYSRRASMCLRIYIFLSFVLCTFSNRIAQLEVVTLFMSCCCCSCSSFFNAHIQIHLHAYAAEKTNSNLHSYTICTLSGANLHMNVRVCVCKYSFACVSTPAFECFVFARRAPYMLTQSC